MIRAVTTILLLLITSLCFAGTSQTQLIVQPIIGYGEAEPWEGNAFRIVDVPFLKKHYQGHPAYEGIAQTNSILTDAPRSERQPESNLLALMDISIGYDFASSTLSLHLSNARKIEGRSPTVREAGFIALECIRIVAHRHGHKPKVVISTNEEDSVFWKKVELRFSTHDLSKPFQTEQGVVPNP